MFRNTLAKIGQPVSRLLGDTNRLLVLALVSAFVFHLALILTRVYRWSFDAYTHMFFAEHYVHSWFGLWEPKWFAGFYVNTYPPLTHQCLALFSFVFGLERAYQILTLLLMVLIPIAVYCFAEIFVSDVSAGYASLLSVFLPSIGEITYFFGQLTTMFGLVSCLFASACLYRFLRNGKALDFALTVSLLGVSVSSHHFSTLFLLPISSFLVVLKSSKEVDWKRFVLRLVLILIVGGIVCLVVVYPFWEFLLGAEMPTPIPHGTTDNIFSNLAWANVFFWNMYGIYLVFILIAFVFVFKNRGLIPLFLTSLFLFVMGLGGATPLPVVLGKWWEWLTYDRFALWAGIMLLPISGLICRAVNDRMRKFELSKPLLIVLLVSLAINCAWVSNWSILYGHPGEVQLEDVKSFLDEGDHWRWRYLTLGFGEAQLAELSVMVNATTLDGCYYIARLLPVLRESGVGAIDASKYYYGIMGEQGLSSLNKVLSDASSYSLKWVFCSDTFYKPILEAHDFAKLCTLSDNVTSVWYHEGVPMLQLSEFERSEISVEGLVWGTAPMTCLLSVLCLVFYKGWFERKR